METFKDIAEAKLKELGVTVGKCEGGSDATSLVFHILPADNEIVANAKDQMEADLNAYVELAEMGGLNVVIIELKEDEDEEEDDEPETE